MHELGVVFHIIDKVNEVAAEHNVTKVNRVVLEVGEVSGIMYWYLQDCWKYAVKKHDVLRDSTLDVETLHAETYCENCKKTYGTVEHGKTCPYCASGNTYLLCGNEFAIKEIEVFDGDVPEAEPEEAAENSKE